MGKWESVIEIEKERERAVWVSVRHLLTSDLDTFTTPQYKQQEAKKSLNFGGKNEKKHFQLLFWRLSLSCTQFYQHLRGKFLDSFPFAIKLQNQTVSTEKLLVKCWWNWHLLCVVSHFSLSEFKPCCHISFTHAFSKLHKVFLVVLTLIKPTIVISKKT